MSKKRTRGSLALLGDVDDLFGIAAASSSARDTEDLSVDGDVDFSPLHSVLSDDFTRGASSARKRQRVSPSAREATPSSLSGSPTTTGESLGGDEIDLLRRKDEERSDMALFLAKAVAETSSSPPLRELVKFLEQTGMPRVLLALKRGAFTEAFLHALATARPRPAHRVLLLCLLVECMAYVSLDAFFQSSVVAFLVDSLIPLDASAQVSASPSSPVRAAAAHWSARPKRAADFAAQTNESPLAAEEEAALHTRVEALCPSVHAAGLSCAASNSGSNSAALALHALLRLVFEYNRSLLVVSPSSFSVPLAIVRAGVLEHLCTCLRDSAARAASLSFLEVLTASDVLRREKVRLLGLVPVLIDLLDSTDSVAASATAASVLKVLTDITNLIPSAFSDTNTVDRFVTYMRGVLSVPTSEAEVDERETFVLCCTINVVLHEAREGASAVMLEPPAFTQAVVADGALLPTLAASMTARYHRTESEQLVLSGYAALLLAALSLVVVDEDGGTLRVPVITAVATASRGTRIGTLTDRQPMRMVAAIIQEFLLFQSASGTLTKEALLEMDALVARLRQHNQISLTAPAVDEEEAKEEEVTLGDLL